MSISSTDLPRAATGPLRIAALVLIIFGTGFVFWGMYAPITTTLSLTGRIVSSKPAFALQHPYGGRVANVLVQLHDQVSRDQPLMILDSALDGARRDAEVSLRARLAQENAVITQILADKTSNAMAETPLGLRYRQSQLRVRMLGDRAEGQAAQQISLGEKLAFAEAQLGLMTARAARQAELVDDGFFARNQSEALEEQRMIVQGEIAGDRERLQALKVQSRDITLQAELAQLSLQSEFATLREENLRRIEALNASIAELEDRIEHAVVRAPIAGTVTDIGFASAERFAPRGATLLSLAQPLDQPHLSIAVPVGQIDQLRTGMTGKLTIPGLPQRNLPPASARITALSPRAEQDQEGNPVAYRGIAEINPEELVQLASAIRPAELSEDMPVMLTVETRQSTFFRYLLSPVGAAFRNAFQD